MTKVGRIYLEFIGSNSVFDNKYLVLTDFPGDSSVFENITVNKSSMPGRSHLSLFYFSFFGVFVPLAALLGNYLCDYVIAAQ